MTIETLTKSYGDAAVGRVFLAPRARLLSSVVISVSASLDPKVSAASCLGVGVGEIHPCSFPPTDCD